MHVLILGYGEMGHAMEALLGPRHELSIWDKFPKAGFQSVRLDDTAPRADVVIFCLPANPHRDVLSEIEPALKPGSVCISIAKGLDDRGKTACEIFDSILEDRSRFALLYGPMIAEEIRRGRPGFAEAGCESADLFTRVAGLFRGSALRLSHSTDLAGIGWAVVLKNVYAVAIGIADGLGMGDNTRGFLVTRALRELEAIVVDKGGQPGTPGGLAGLGDLVTTATSTGSHHRALGDQLARGETADITGEGVHTLAMVAKHGLLDIERCPLLATVHNIIHDPRRADELLNDFVGGAFD